MTIIDLPLFRICQVVSHTTSDNNMIPSNETVPPDVLVIDEPEQPEPYTGRQKARAAVAQLHPPEMLALFQESKCQKLTQNC